MWVFDCGTRGGLKVGELEEVAAKLEPESVGLVWSNGTQKCRRRTTALLDRRLVAGLRRTDGLGETNIGPTVAVGPGYSRCAMACANSEPEGPVDSGDEVRTERRDFVALRGFVRAK